MVKESIFIVKKTHQIHFVTPSGSVFPSEVWLEFSLPTFEVVSSLLPSRGGVRGGWRP